MVGIGEGFPQSQVLSNEIAPTAPNPWANLAPQAPKEKPRTARKKEPEISSETAQAMKRFKEDIRQKEELGKAQFEVTMDSNALEKIVVPEPRGLPEQPSKFDVEDYERTMKVHRELMALKDRMLKLPEKLQFQPGVTLIVGENGAGKSTLAKALFLRATCEVGTLREKIDAVFMKRGDEFEHAGEVTHRITLEPAPTDYQSSWLNQAGLAPDIAKAMVADNFYASTGNSESVKYEDFPEKIGESRGLDEKYALAGMTSGKFEGYDKPLYGQYRSHRQTVDKTIEGIKRENEWDNGPKIYFFDEPETGMSPRRHKHLEQDIMNTVGENSITICPTNSMVLFDSDLPRIDLDYPERGIHRPGQYPETKQIAS